ncbi:hypothetical protein [Collimonas sp.]|jgi:hypothetical protein|uniref:hypothetical protein n=1 Tax=Collimonas sp. TaxID=1963772 RepID=UPI002CBB3337|nr:hypothetical protein [Collimonas sp.]HWW07748.1 hypothetical protein [Collimonas sp.]
MEQLQQIVSDSFAKIVSSGVIEAAIEKKLTETINSILDSELRSYSDFGKQLGAQVKSALNVDFANLQLPGYNDLILSIVRKQVNALVAKSAALHVEEQMTVLLASPPAEIKLSKLVADFIEANKPDGCACGDSDHISLLVEKSDYDYCHIYMDKDAGKSRYSCDIQVHVNTDGRVYSLKIDDKEIGKSLFVGPMYGFDLDLFQMYAAGTKLIVDGDEHSIDTYYPGHDN